MVNYSQKWQMRCHMFMGQTGFKKGCMLLSYKQEFQIFCGLIEIN